jgi:hypothetical protein
MVYFGTNYDADDIQTVCINGEFIKHVKTFKLLGVHIRCELVIRHGTPMLINTKI